MGNPTPTPPVIGEPCAQCDGILWPPGDPPRFILVELKNLVKCPACPDNPPNGLWLLEQVAGQTNWWDYTDANYYLLVELDPGGTDVSVAGPPPGLGWAYFYSHRAGCSSDSTNFYGACLLGVGSKDGTAEIFWPL